MKKTLISIILISILSLSTLAGCSAKPQTSDNDLTDRSGNKIDRPAKIEKIISMAPSITETLVALGLGDKIIAIDTYSASIEGIQPELSQFDIMNPDAEMLIALEPDIIIVSDLNSDQNANRYKQISDTGICITTIPTATSIQAIKDDISFLGNVTNTSDQSDKIITDMEDKIAEIQSISKTITDKRTVYFEIAAAPDLYTFGKNVFLNEMLEIIGSTNIMADQDGWVSVTEESIISANPDVILTNVNYIDDTINEIKNRSNWKDMTAIKDNQVYYIDNMASTVPDFNITKALEQMAEAIYPDKFSK